MKTYKYSVYQYKEYLQLIFLDIYFTNITLQYKQM